MKTKFKVRGKRFESYLTLSQLTIAMELAHKLNKQLYVVT